MSQTTKRIIFQLSFLSVAFLLIEIVLRLLGHQPGDLKPNWSFFQPVDSLVTDSLCYTNPEGILIAHKQRWSGEGFYINRDGFRTGEFDRLDSNKRKIMLIGDSFVWGSSARPLGGNCFADILQKETAYEIINLGIQAVDPVQYMLVAQKYIPLLKPDLVLVFFYMGNDLMREDRPYGAGKPNVYLTNAGAIQANDGKLHFNSAEHAYNYFVNEKYYLKNPKGILEWTVSKSAVLSMLYSVRFRWIEKQEYENAVKNSFITKKYLHAIMQQAKQHHVPVKFVLIPELKETDMDSLKYASRYASLLNDAQLAENWVVPHPSASYYLPYPDAHLNNEGHRYYADFLKAYLQQQLPE